MPSRRRPKPRVFVASSRESLPLANAIQANLAEELDTMVWNQDVIKPSTFVLESLVEAIPTFDAGIFVLAPDDVRIRRGKKGGVARDNVILELGLFLGALGRHRAFIVVPSGGDLEIPSDLLGLVPLEYDGERLDSFRAALNPACVGSWTTATSMRLGSS